MIDPSVAATVGVPNESVTHWGIMRKERDRWVRLDTSGDRGVRVKEFPLSDLTVDWIRERFGPGEYRLCWLALDPGASMSSERRKPQGNGSVFTLDPLPDDDADEPEAVVGAAPRPSSDAAAAMRLFEMADARAEKTLDRLVTLIGLRQQAQPVAAAPAAAPSSLNDEERAELQRLRTAVEVRRALDEQRAIFEQRNDRLERRIRDLEAEPEPTEGPFRAGAPITETIVTTALNALAKNPEVLAPILLPVMQKLMGPNAPALAAAPPQGPVVEAGPIAPPVPHVPSEVSPAAVVGQPIPFRRPNGIRRPVQPGVSRETVVTAPTPPSEAWQPIAAAAPDPPSNDVRTAPTEPAPSSETHP